MFLEQRLQHQELRRQVLLPEGTAEALAEGGELACRLLPGEREGAPFIGIDMLPGYRFPFEVSVGVDPKIGGPSAGLMFSLAIYDTLTPGSLTDGSTVAGTGTRQFLLPRSRSHA